jgi:hypothetical protein
MQWYQVSIAFVTVIFSVYVNVVIALSLHFLAKPVARNK